jgi:hypothetical protein
MDSVRDLYSVSWVGSCGGVPPQLMSANGKDILILEGPKLIEPAKDDFRIIKVILLNLLGKEQLEYFNGWVKWGLENLLNVYRGKEGRPGQFVALIGPKGAGKNLVQERIITRIFGGRVAKPTQFFNDRTNFNGDLVGAEHWLLSDETPARDIDSRRAFGNHIKGVAANSEVRTEIKFGHPVVLRPFRRGTVSLNDEDENIRTLPRWMSLSRTRSCSSNAILSTYPCLRERPLRGLLLVNSRATFITFCVTTRSGTNSGTSDLESRPTITRPCWKLCRLRLQKPSCLRKSIRLSHLMSKRREIGIGRAVPTISRTSSNQTLRLGDTRQEHDITIQVPVDFGTEKEKELRQSFTQELPGLTLTIQGSESVAKPRISAISIDDFAYVRSAKAAEEWRNAAEKAELKSDPFPVVGWAASRTLIN